MRIAGILLSILCLSGFYVIKSGMIFGKSKKFTLDKLRPVGNRIKQISELSEKMTPIFEYKLDMTWSDLARIYANDRIVVRVADEARLKNPGDANEFAALHAEMVDAHCKTLKFIRRAGMEWVSNHLGGSATHLYAYAAVWSYSQEVLILSNMLELADSENPYELEEHI